MATPKKIIAVFGYGGRMGQAIASLGPQFADQAEIIDYKSVATKTAQDKKIDALIDFSNVDAFAKALAFASENKIPMVTGTTGLSDGQKKELESAGSDIPVLWDANMSLGMQWFLQAIKAVSNLPEAFDLQVEETHHKHKVDAPSGTAIEIQKNIEQASGRTLPDALAIRGGGVFGNHKVYMMGDEEVITFEHQVLDRKVFARGAIVAALWLADQPKGFYRMSDLIQSNNNQA